MPEPLSRPQPHFAQLKLLKMESLQEVRVFLQQVAKAGTCLDRNGVRRLYRLVLAAKTCLRARAHQLLDGHPGCPCLVQYSCDCTPVRTKQTTTVGQHQAQIKRRKISGHQTQEFLVQQVFVTICSAPGDLHHSVLLADPLALRHGKSMPALLAVALQCPGLHFLCGSPRIKVFHQVHDRAMSQSFRTALAAGVPLQSRSQVGMPGVAEADPGDAHADCLWHSTVGCACHDAHNALRWAVQLSQGEPDLVKNIFLGLATVRKLFFTMVGFMDRWLPLVAEGVDAHSLPMSATLEAAYSLFGADEEQVKVLVSARLHWTPDLGRLLVHQDFLAQPDAVSQISAVLLDIWRFPAFSASRWVTFGTSAKRFALAVMTGMMSLVEYVVQQGGLSDYEASGAAFLSAEERRWCCHVGLVATVPDTFLLGVLSDSRLAHLKYRCLMALFAQIQGG